MDRSRQVARPADPFTRCRQGAAMSDRATDWRLHLALWVTALVVLPRAVLIARVHTPCVDDQYHLDRGIAFWSGKLGSMPVNDPPLGEAIIALPLVACTWLPAIPRLRD